MFGSIWTLGRPLVHLYRTQSINRDIRTKCFSKSKNVLYQKVLQKPLKDIVRVWPTNEIFENIFASLNFLKNTPDRYHVNMKKYLWNQVFQILTSIFSYDLLQLLVAGGRKTISTNFGQIMEKLDFQKKVEYLVGHVPYQESDIRDRKHTPQRCF